MARYVDGFLFAIPKDNVEAYRKLAQQAGEIWKEYGALEYVECVGDDVPEGKVTDFPMSVKAKSDEIVGFAWITYESREPVTRSTRRSWPTRGWTWIPRTCPSTCHAWSSAGSGPSSSSEGRPLG